jgi:predicted phosphodiesterase
MRIIVITDAHANLPALRAVLSEASKIGYDAIYHTGDAIAIGPFPAECLDLLLNTPRVTLLMGNHDSYFVRGLPEPRAWMSEDEEQHQRWTHARLSPASRDLLARWPYILEGEFEGTSITFAHYGITESRQDFVPVVREPTAADLDRVFSRCRGSLVFFGHDHWQSDIQGRKRYVNPGSLGCSREAVARYCVAEFSKGKYTIENRSVSYNDEELYKAFELRDVPTRKFIFGAFYGGRFQPGMKGH